ncbi:MAG: hypothetical protein HY321_08520, partial [Armatimonadetes bacterium]|nr:hypothetical protein [Armatimonadota bacterium]
MMKTQMSWFGVIPAAATLITAFATPTGAQDAQQSRSPFQEAYDAAKRNYTGGYSPGPPVQFEALDFPAAREGFRRALGLAATDAEKAEAVLGMGRAFLSDVNAIDDAAARGDVRADYARALALKAISPEQRADAHLGTAETYLGDRSYGAAREVCARAREASGEPALAARAQMLLARCYLQERNYSEAQKEFRKLLEMEGLERQMKWEAEALLGAIPLVPLIRTDHPRLFFNAETWPAVKERALTAERALFDQMKARVDALSIDDTRAGNFGVQAMEAAFVYRVTGDRSVLEKVRRMLRATVDAFLENRPEDSRAYPRVAWAAALDWVWNDLPTPERESLADAMTHYAAIRIAEGKVHVRGQITAWPHYYVGSMFAYAGIVLLDPAADDVAYARAVQVLAFGLKHHQERFSYLIGASGDDGVWQTNIEYDLTEVPNAVWGFLYAWQPATGLEMPKEWSIVGVSPNMALRMMIGMGPKYYKHFNYGGHSNGAWGWGQVYSSALYAHLGHYVNLFGQSHPEEAAIAQYLRQRMVETGAGPSEGVYPVFQFLMTGSEQAPAPVLPPGLPVARYFGSIGLVLMSSGFGPDDTYALFSQGGGASLAAPQGRRLCDYDATHFTIYKKGFLALDTGVRFALPHSPNYRHQTVAHNAVLIHMPGEQFPRTVTGPAIANTGGQNRYPVDAVPLAFETERLFAYTAVDATPVYNEAKCARMVRQFLFLPPDHFVVFDRVVSTKAEYPKTWLLHTANEPMIAGREFRSDQDQGRLFCRTLYPLDAVLEKIGGPGKEFWADGRNWPITDAFQEPGVGNWWKRFGHGETEPVEAMGRWRVEVKPGAARAEDCFLHLIQASDQTVEKMVESRTSETADQVQLAFAVGARSYAISLN